MGKGDRRTRKGKIFNGSYGARRPHDASGKSEPLPSASVQPLRPGRPSVRPPR
jgi:ribosomal small subunit protein bTHX